MGPDAFLPETNIGPAPPQFLYWKIGEVSDDMNADDDADDDDDDDDDVTPEFWQSGGVNDLPTGEAIGKHDVICCCCCCCCCDACRNDAVVGDIIGGEVNAGTVAAGATFAFVVLDIFACIFLFLMIRLLAIRSAFLASLFDVKKTSQTPLKEFLHVITFLAWTSLKS